MSLHLNPRSGALTALFLMTLMTAPPLTAALEPLHVGETLPVVTGQYLTGRSVTLPEGVAGKTTLLLMGFTYASRTQVEAWGEWFRKTVGTSQTVTFVEMPMIGGMAKLGRWFIDRGMRKGTPAELHENVITVYANAGDWKRRLGVSDTNDKDAFLIVIDRDGVVRWLDHGPLDAVRSEQMKAVLAGGIP